ncbi:glutathione S-transferase [Rhizodiscina lignyota]|uniref:Glutathione S-transferase n=1 Tax=Rhizodiscina lignyota TaxID=1504668 RepID=A0A9P4M3J3_9PEZI|nr:glutathione S-transferase [Rhizodiscina lignyota]
MAQPIKLYVHVFGPNPWKVAIILEELGVRYDTISMDYADLKKEPFESLNPNCRVPAIEDPNTGIVLFESGAIVEYLVEIWLHFQMSGQGPYFGQSIHFQRFHPNNHEPIQLPTAIERYKNEGKRVVGVIDKHLKKHGTGYVVGDKLTYADLAFVPWNVLLSDVMGEDFDPKVEAPDFAAWHDNMAERPSVKRAYKKKQTLVDDFMKSEKSI